MIWSWVDSWSTSKTAIHVSGTPSRNLGTVFIHAVRYRIWKSSEAPFEVASIHFFDVMRSRNLPINFLYRSKSNPSFLLRFSATPRYPVPMGSPRVWPRSGQGGCTSPAAASRPRAGSRSASSRWGRHFLKEHKIIFVQFDAEWQRALNRSL